MPLQLDLKNQDLLSLKDAIAYEFFMDNVSAVINGADKEDKSIVEEIAKVAKASYMIANIFCLAREHNTEQNNDTDA